jgi:hypothetical protein
MAFLLTLTANRKDSSKRLSISHCCKRRHHKIKTKRRRRQRQRQKKKKNKS